MSMNPEVKAKWVAALRSGEFKQGKDRLKTEDSGRCSFCCLGVLSELHRRETSKGYWDIGQHGAGADELCYFATLEGGKGGDISSDVHLPTAVQHWAGLSTPDPNVAMAISGKARIDNVRIDSVSSFNDLGVPFEILADIIEKQL